MRCKYCCLQVASKMQFLGTSLACSIMQDLVVTSNSACPHGQHPVLHTTGWVLQGDVCLTWARQHSSAALECRDSDAPPAAALMYRSSEQGSTLFERLVAALEEHAEGRVIYLTGVHAACDLSSAHEWLALPCLCFDPCAGLSM